MCAFECLHITRGHNIYNENTQERQYAIHSSRFPTAGALRHSFYNFRASKRLHSSCRGLKAREVTPLTLHDLNARWLLCLNFSHRLAELCGKLDEAEALARGEHQLQHRHRHRHHKRSGSFDPDVASDGRGGGGGGGRSDSHTNQPSRQPMCFGEFGSGVTVCEAHDKRYDVLLFLLEAEIVVRGTRLSMGTVSVIRA